MVASAQAGADGFNLADLSGANGFRLDGSKGVRLDGLVSIDRSGSAVSSAGDINGDGIDDLIIGAPSAEPSGTDSGSLRLRRQPERRGGDYPLAMT
jgi:hypothetical protein